MSKNSRIFTLTFNIYLSVIVSNKISRFFNIDLTFIKCVIFINELKLRGFHRNTLASYFYSCCSMVAKKRLFNKPVNKLFYAEELDSSIETEVV